jgi:elongation factor 1-gamma
MKSPEYLKKHPLGKVPLLDTPEGPIYESNAILRYLARKQKSLYGSNVFETAQVDQWLDFQNN